jgi:hypothetical protein
MLSGGERRLRALERIDAQEIAMAEASVPDLPIDTPFWEGAKRGELLVQT